MNKRYLEIAEIGIFVLGLLFYLGFISNRSLSQATGIGLPLLETLNSLVRYGLWSSTTLLVCLRWKIAWAVAKRNKFAWIVAGLSIMSTLWSANSTHTSLVVSEVVRMTTFGLYVASRFKLRQQLHILAFTLGGIALLSALLAIALPAVGVDQKAFAGAWTGIFNHKNTLGKFMSLSVATFSVLVVAQKVHVTRIYRVLTWGGLCLSYALVLLSTSQTSFSISSLFIVAVFIYRLYQNQGNKRQLYLELASLSAVVFIIVVSSSWEMIIASMGRDLTLTGRTDIWGSALSQLMDKSPWLGFGRGTFWGPNSSFARVAGAAVSHKYIPPNAHNGYLEVALEIGIIGLVCFLVSLFTAYRHAIIRSFVSSTPKDLWPLVFLTWLIAYNFTESSLLINPNVTWPLYVTVALCAMPSGRTVYFRVRRPRSSVIDKAASATRPSTG